MKKTLLIMVVFLMASLVYADEVIFNGTMSSIDSITIDDVDYSIRVSAKTNNVFVESIYSRIIVSQGKVETKGYYTFFFEGFNDYEFEDYAEASMTITKFDCLEYLNDDDEMVCKLHVGEDCEEDSECMSSKCLHGVCTYTYPICGDGHCDENENCDDDCDEPEEEPEDKEDDQEEEELVEEDEENMLEEEEVIIPVLTNENESQEEEKEDNTIEVVETTAVDTHDDKKGFKINLRLIGLIAAGILVVAALIALGIKNSRDIAEPEKKDNEQKEEKQEEIQEEKNNGKKETGAKIGEKKKVKKEKADNSNEKDKKEQHKKEVNDDDLQFEKAN